MRQPILITSGKGGTGKTSVTAGVGSCLAALGRKTVCIDADIGVRNLDIVLGLSEQTVFDFNDVLSGRADIAQALVYHPEIQNLAMLPAPTGVFAGDIDAKAFSELISELQESFEFVLLDSPAGLDTGFRLAARMCKTAIIVTSLDTLAAREAARTADLLRDEYNYEEIKLLINRVRPKLVSLNHAMCADDVMDQAGAPLLGLIPEDELVIAAANLGRPVILASHNGAARSYLNIARRLMGENVELMRMKQWRVE